MTSGLYNIEESISSSQIQGIFSLVYHQDTVGNIEFQKQKLFLLVLLEVQSHIQTKLNLNNVCLLNMQNYDR